MLNKKYCRNCQTPVENNLLLGAGLISGRYYCPTCKETKFDSEVMTEEEQSYVAEQEAELVSYCV